MVDSAVPPVPNQWYQRFREFSQAVPVRLFLTIEKWVWTNANGVWHGRYGLKLGGAAPGHWRAERMEWGRFGMGHQEPLTFLHHWCNS